MLVQSVSINPKRSKIRFNYMINKYVFVGLASTAVLFSLSSSSLAFEKMQGCFVASQNCEAFRSIRKKTNPGHIRLEPGVSYPLKGKNKPAATHYQLRIQALKTPDRWVAISCGKVVEQCAAASGEKQAAQQHGKKHYEKKRRYGGKHSGKVKGNGHYLFAVSWEPAFCEGHRGKAECKSMTQQSVDANNLSLHGLWPQPRNNAYCNVTVAQKSLDRAHKWGVIKPLGLSAKTMEELKKVMPGVQSNLQRHEWVKHGSCYKDGSAEVYYQHSIDLINKLNLSGVNKLFKDNIGKSLSSAQIRTAFDKAFGIGSGAKVNVRCDRKRKYISELWINLQGEINQATSFADLLKGAKPARNSCQGGLVDKAGYNN